MLEALKRLKKTVAWHLIGSVCLDNDRRTEGPAMVCVVLVERLKNRG
jgi:hypothetical protein